MKNMTKLLRLLGAVWFVSGMGIMISEKNRISKVIKSQNEFLNSQKAKELLQYDSKISFSDNYILQNIPVVRCPEFVHSLGSMFAACGIIKFKDQGNSILVVGIDDEFLELSSDIQMAIICHECKHIDNMIHLGPLYKSNAQDEYSANVYAASICGKDAMLRVLKLLLKSQTPYTLKAMILQRIHKVQQLPDIKSDVEIFVADRPGADKKNLIRFSIRRTNVSVG